MLAVVWFLAIFVSCTGYRTSAVPPTPTPDPQTLEKYAPAVINSVTFSDASNSRRALVVLHTRGSVDGKLPASTLRNYTLRWAVTSRTGETKFSEGDVLLPTLAPGTDWSGEVGWNVPEADYVFTVSIIRPTGFTVIERKYDVEGELIKDEAGK